MKSRSDFQDQNSYDNYLIIAFTMAAMQGLCSNVNPTELTADDVELIAHSAAEVAQRTLHRLSELSKYQ